MRSIEELFEMAARADMRVYVFLRDDATRKSFVSDAVEAGIKFRDGADVRSREVDDIMALNSDRTINYVGTVGHIAFMTKADMSDKTIIRIDYGRYAAGMTNYII